MASITTVSVITNSFEITQLPTREYYLYDVTFSPDIPIANKRERVVAQLQTEVAPNIFNPLGIYDGRHLFFATHLLHLPGGGIGSFTVSLGTGAAAAVGHGVFEVRIVRTSGGVIRPVDFQNLLNFAAGRADETRISMVKNVINLLIRQEANQNHPTNKGGAYFSPAGRKEVADSGIELWRGYHQAVRLTGNRVLITIDTAITAVYHSGFLLDVAGLFLGKSNTRHLSLNDDRELRKLQAYLKNRRVNCKTTGNTTKTIYEVIPGPIGERRFEKDGISITIAEHLRRAHGIQLRSPGSFGVRISGSSAPFKVIVPAEIVHVLPGQLYKKRLPPDATDAAVKFATMRPRERLLAITDGSSNTMLSPIRTYQSSQFVHQAGMRIDARPLQLEAKIIAAPYIQFAADHRRPHNGSWNVLGQKFKNAMRMMTWGFINFEYRLSKNEAIDMMQILVACCETLGMTVDKPTAWKQGDAMSAEKELDRLLDDIRQSGKPVDMIIVLLPAQAEETRNIVKYWGDVKHGIRTSCLREPKLRKAVNQYKQRNDSQYWNNCAIKLNARLGGRYAVPEFHEIRRLQQEGPFIVMGTDVSHPGPGSNRPSTASMVWSWNADATSYVAYTAIQDSRLEIIQNLREMVRNALRTFRQQSPDPPKKIIMYRDGCSEGEIPRVREVEVAAIQDACRDVWTRFKIDRNQYPLPKITFIVVVKRHHVVFFPNSPDAGDGKTDNCRAGLAVEGLQSPLTPGFYLQSHAPIQGTARSGQYSILEDQNFGFNYLRIQQLSFELCHVYAKATRSISIPAPVYYADLVCARAKFHFDPAMHMNFDAATTASGPDDFDLEYWKKAFRPVSDKNDYDKSMYFL